MGRKPLQTDLRISLNNKKLFTETVLVETEVRRHIKVFGDPDDITITLVRCPPLKIPAEGTA